MRVLGNLTIIRYTLLPTVSVDNILKTNVAESRDDDFSVSVGAAVALGVMTF